MKDVYNLKNRFIKICPNRLFPLVSNLYYTITPKEKVKIKKTTAGWLIQKGVIKLLSPTPKFIGFGLKTFENKFEKPPNIIIERGDTVLDVGACIGDTTIPMAIKTGEEGKKIAIEPHPINIRYLKHNLSIYKNVEIFKKAAWNIKQNIDFNISYAPTGHSIIPNSKGRKEGCIKVQADTLDNMLVNRMVDYAKIDVQDAEIQVLEGASKFLKTIKKLVIKTHNWTNPEKRTYPKVLEILQKYNNLKILQESGIIYVWRQ